METFSEQYGYSQPSRALIVESMPHTVEIATKNAMNDFLNSNKVLFEKIDKLAWKDFANEDVEEYDDFKKHNGYYILDAYDGSIKSWIKKLDLLDFILLTLKEVNNQCQEETTLCRNLNKQFERLHYGYRIINNQVTPITDKGEIETIEESIGNVTDNIKIHLESAFQELSKRVSPNYRNVVHESISAVEGFCSNYTKKGTLSDSLVEIQKKSIIHPQLIAAFKNLYRYTCEGDVGSRHALEIENSKYVPSFNEAKFMLVTCSAIINYLKSVLDDMINK